MKNPKSFVKKPFLFLAILSVMAITSCQKEETQEFTAEESTSNDVDFRATLLQLAYGIPADQLDTPESDEMYATMMKGLTEGQLTQLEELVQIYTTDNQAPTTTVGEKLDFRSLTETILSGENNGDYFGYSVAKNAYTNTLFVGARAQGKVYVYQNNVLVQTLDGPGSFGYQVATDGLWLAVLAGTNPDGVVIIFKKQSGSWVQHSVLNPGFLFSIDATGADIAMQGSRLAVLGRNAGISGIKVYKLLRNEWFPETTLEDGNTFWWDVDLYGSTVVANGGSNVGSGVVFNPKVYIFKKVYSNWGLTTVPFPQPGNLLARYVAIHNTTIVANVAFNSTKSYVITPSSGSWAISGELVNPNLGSQGVSQGRRLAIEGSKAVVTYPTLLGSSDPNDAAFVFEQSGGAWNLTETLTPSTGGLNYEFGFRAAISGNQVFIGAPATSTLPGAVFIYE